CCANRRRPAGGWLPPSRESRLANTATWLRRLCRGAHVTALSQELVRFDTQALQHPELSGVEYQQGTLAGYELREYLLEQWGQALCVLPRHPCPAADRAPCAACTRRQRPGQQSHPGPSGLQPAHRDADG